MKILHVLTQLPQRTGSGVYFTNLIESLAQQGVENGAIFGIEKSYEIKVEADYVNPVYYNKSKLPFRICGMSDEMPYDSTVYSQMSEEEIKMLKEAFREKLKEAKKEFNPDIVISHHLFFITDLVREVFNDTKVVGISHGTDIRQIKKHPRFLDKLTNIKDLDYVLTVTDKEDYAIINQLKVEENKLLNVGGGYNDKVFYPPTKTYEKDTIDIVYAGKVSQSKGVFELAKTLPILEKKYPQIRLYIIGNLDEESFHRIKKDAKDSKRLIICHAVNQEKLSNILRKSDIFVLPSYFEALGLIAIEALACNKLVVSSEIEGLKEALGEEIINSKVIEFTKLPRIYDIDKPYEEDVGAYVERLAINIEKQINRLNDSLFTDEIIDSIHQLSWSKIGEKILSLITEKNIWH